MAPVRVLVVDDSATVRRRLCAVLKTDPGVTVLGEAEDGKGAIELCQELRPDVISMDMIMPVMGGLSACEYIMAYCPTPILVVSASLNRGELFKTYDALAAGAVDVLEKPRGDEPAGVWEANYIETLKLVSRIRVIRHPKASLETLGSQHPHLSFVTPASTARSIPPSAPEGIRVVAIGASTGGPSAIVKVLRGLPEDFDLPILLVIHIGAAFARAFAEWLDGESDRSVRWAIEGERVASIHGGVVMAPADQHMSVLNGRLRLTRDPERHSCRPSVDVLFESVASEYGPSSAAALLTGMGRDGASGLLAIRQRGGRTIAQDEATSVVYGMPREAALIDAAERILPLGEIGPALAGFALAEARAS